MSTELSNMEDPNERTLESTLPEIQQKFDQLHMEVRDGQFKIISKIGQVEEKMDTVLTRTELGNALSALGSQLAPSPGESPAVQQNSEEEAQQDNGEDNEDWNRAANYTIQITDTDTVVDLYNEFKGRGKFDGMPIDGGMEACDKRWKTAWRTHIKGAQQK